MAARCSSAFRGCCGLDLVAGRDPGQSVRVGLGLPRVAAQHDPHPDDPGSESAEQCRADKPVDDRVETVGTERGRWIAGVEQHGEPRRRAGVWLGCAGEERGDATSGAEDESDPEHADQANEGGVGEFVAHAPGLPLVHVSRPHRERARDAPEQDHLVCAVRAGRRGR